MSLFDTGGGSGGNKGGSKLPSKFPKRVAVKKANIAGVFWVGQRFYGLWSGGATPYMGFATHSLVPCVGLVLTAPGMAMLAHLDSDFHSDEGCRRNALRNLRVLISQIPLVNRPNIRAYIYADRGTHVSMVSSRMMGLFLFGILSGIINPANITLNDKQGFSGLMVVNFGDGTVVMQADTQYDVGALNDTLIIDGGIIHRPIYV